MRTISYFFRKIAEANWTYRWMRLLRFLWPITRFFGAERILDEEINFRRYFKSAPDKTQLPHVKMTLENMAREFLKQKDEYECRRDGYRTSRRGSEKMKKNNGIGLELDSREFRSDMKTLRKATSRKHDDLMKAHAAAHKLMPDRIPEDLANPTLIPITNFRKRIAEDFRLPSEHLGEFMVSERVS